MNDLTPCGPLCDGEHKITEPHNRNLAPAQPDDHQAKRNQQKAEADDTPVTFDWDGEEWTIKPSDATGLEFLAALEDAESGEDPSGMIRALRHLLGREQAARLFKGRTVETVAGFFDAAGEVAGTGNR